MHQLNNIKLMLHLCKMFQKDEENFKIENEHTTANTFCVGNQGRKAFVQSNTRGVALQVDH